LKKETNSEKKQEVSWHHHSYSSNTRYP
jgi:hypothetical protein